jgi:hemerythrin
MAYFEWGSDLKVGNALLDHDHQQLVGLVNQLHSATCQGKGKEVVGGILGELIRYTQEHFHREEQYMESVRYPALASHKVEHTQLLSKVRELQHRFKDGDGTVAAHVSSFLRDWLSLHIMRSDKKLAALIAHKES